MTDLCLKTDVGTFNPRVAGIIMSEDKILLCKNIREGHYFLPGGRVCFGEDSETAIVREVKEELGLDSKIARLVWVNENFFTYKIAQEKTHEICFYYLLELSGFESNVNSREFERTDIDGKIVYFKWHNLNELNEINLRPDFVKNELKSIPTQVTKIITKN